MSRLSIPSRGNARAASRPKLGANRREYLNDVQAEAAVGRVGKVSQTTGRAAGTDIVPVKTFGFTEPQILEIALLVAVNFLIHLADDVAFADDNVPAVTARAT